MVDETRIIKQYNELSNRLMEKNLTITTMESATSGLIASLITDTKGTSAILKGAFVTYCNEAKVLQGVDKSIIDQYGVYSSETASAMAACAKKAYQADIGIGVTGTLGNVDPDNEDSVPGKVYVAIDVQGEVTNLIQHIPYQKTRHAYKMAVAQMIVENLLNLI